jgi:hypothetical protein
MGRSGSPEQDMVALRSVASSKVERPIWIQKGELHVTLEGIADEPARTVLQGHETMAEAGSQESEPAAFGEVDEDHHGRLADKGSGDDHELPP